MMLTEQLPAMTLTREQKELITAAIKELNALKLTGNPLFFASTQRVLHELGHSIMLEARWHTEQ